jgi:hypothetical protein
VDGALGSLKCRITGHLPGPGTSDIYTYYFYPLLIWRLSALYSLVRSPIRVYLSTSSCIPGILSFSLIATLLTRACGAEDNWCAACAASALCVSPAACCLLLWGGVHCCPLVVDFRFLWFCMQKQAGEGGQGQGQGLASCFYSLSIIISIFAG